MMAESLASPTFLEELSFDIVENGWHFGQKLAKTCSSEKTLLNRSKMKGIRLSGWWTRSAKLETLGLLDEYLSDRRCFRAFPCASVRNRQKPTSLTSYLAKLQF